MTLKVVEELISRGRILQDIVEEACINFTWIVAMNNFDFKKFLTEINGIINVQVELNYDKKLN